MEKLALLLAPLNAKKCTQIWHSFSSNIFLQPLCILTSPPLRRLYEFLEFFNSLYLTTIRTPYLFIYLFISNLFIVDNFS